MFIAFLVASFRFASSLSVQPATSDTRNKDMRTSRTALCIVFFMALFLIFEVTFAFAASPSQDILGKISGTFYSKAEAWASTLENAAKTIFYWLLVIDIAVFGVRGAIDMKRGVPVASLFGEFAILIFFSALMFSCLTHYKEWSNNVINGFSTLGQNLGSSKVLVGDFFRTGLIMAGNVWDAMSLFEPIVSLGFLLSGFVLLFCFALMAAEVLLIKCESYIVMNAGIFLLGFGGMRYFRDQSINFMKYGFTVAVKLFVIQLLMSMAMSFTNDFRNIEPTWANVAVIMGASLVMVMLVRTIPSVFTSLIMGAHGSSGASALGLIAAAGAAGGAVGGAIGGGINTANTISAATGAATAQGLSGAAKVANVGRTLAGAMGKSAAEGLTGSGGGSSFGKRTASHAQSARDQAEMDKQ